MGGTGLALRLLLARASAWALLLAGWVGLGSVALVLASGTVEAFALVAAWLLALGAVARVALPDGPHGLARWGLLFGAAVIAVLALLASTRGGGLAALFVALLAWAALTALASGVVRRLRLVQALPPGPPVGAAALGALVAGLVLGDPSDLPALTVRLALLVGALALLLAALQVGAPAVTQARRCRAGLFDCSLPAWPAGAWRDLHQWPGLLAGLAMLPMMAALPLMAAWCRTDAIAPQATVLLHLAAMFLPALLLHGPIARGSPRLAAAVCTIALLAGAIAALWAPPPWHLLLLAAAHGTAWGLAWAGQLWSPQRRGRDGSSPLRAALGYALLTFGFGFVVQGFGAAGVVAVHAALAGAALLAWCAGLGRDAVVVRVNKA